MGCVCVVETSYEKRKILFFIRAPFHTDQPHQMAYLFLLPKKLQQISLPPILPSSRSHNMAASSIPRGSARWSESGGDFSSFSLHFGRGHTVHFTPCPCGVFVAQSAWGSHCQVGGPENLKLRHVSKLGKIFGNDPSNASNCNPRKSPNLSAKCQSLPICLGPWATLLSSPHVRNRSSVDDGLTCRLQKVRHVEMGDRPRDRP